MFKKLVYLVMVFFGISSAAVAKDNDTDVSLLMSSFWQDFEIDGSILRVRFSVPSNWDNDEKMLKIN